MSSIKLTQLAVVFAILVFSVGCQTTSSSTTGAVEIKAKWNGKIPYLPILSDSENTVLLRVKNSSGSDLEIKNAVREAILNESYLIVENLNDASYVARMDLTYFGESLGDSTHYGTFGGAVAGAAVGGVVGKQSNNTGTGALLGGVSGAVIGELIDRANRKIVYDLVIDVTMEVKGGQRESCRLVLSASGSRLTPDTAFPLLERRLSRALGSVLP